MNGRSWKEYAAAAGVMAVCTGAGTVLLPVLSITDVAMLFLLAVGLVAARSARGPSFFAAVLSVACFDFFFVPPRFTFVVDDLHYVLTFALMLVCAAAIGNLTQRVRADAVANELRARGVAALYPMSGELLEAVDLPSVVAVIGRHMRSAFGADVLVLLRDPERGLVAASVAGASLDDRQRGVAQQAFDTWETTGLGTQHFPEVGVLCLPLVGTSGRIGVLVVRPATSASARLDDRTVQWVLQTFAGQAALALERAQRGGKA